MNEYTKKRAREPPETSSQVEYGRNSEPKQNTAKLQPNPSNTTNFPPTSNNGATGVVPVYKKRGPYSVTRKLTRFSQEEVERFREIFKTVQVPSRQEAERIAEQDFGGKYTVQKIEVCIPDRILDNPADLAQKFFFDERRRTGFTKPLVALPAPLPVIIHAVFYAET